MRFWFGVLAVLALAGWVGTAGVTRLANDLPLLLIVLSPVNRHLVLVAPTVPPEQFLTVAILRGLLSCIVGFQLGRAVGESGLRWLEGNSPGVSRIVRWIERLFKRSAPVAIVALPGLVVSLLAGVAGTKRRTFVSLALVGLTIRMVLILWLGQLLLEPIKWLLQAFDRHWIPITAGIVALLVLNQWRQRARMPKSDRVALDSDRRPEPRA